MTQMTISCFRIDCPDGKLTASSFRKIYTKCFPGGNVNEFCDHVFRTFDMDKNGFVDFKEFLLAIDVTSTGTPEEKLQWAFRCEYNCREKNPCTSQTASECIIMNPADLPSFRSSKDHLSLYEIVQFEPLKIFCLTLNALFCPSLSWERGCN